MQRRLRGNIVRHACAVLAFGAVGCGGVFVIGDVSRVDAGAGAGADGGAADAGAPDGGAVDAGQVEPDAGHQSPCEYGPAGPSWEVVPSPVGVDLHGVFAVARDDAWITGAEGTILHFDGVSWTIHTQVPRPGTSIGALWMADATEGWATAVDGIMHFDGVTWRHRDDVRLDRFGSIVSVWGSGRDDVWIGGGSISPQAQMLGHWDGNAWGLSWDVTESPISVNMLHGTGANNAWGVMQLGRLIRRRDGAWRLEAGPGGQGTITSVHVLDDHEAFFSALRGQAYRWRDGAWETFFNGSDETYDYDVWASSSDNAWVVGWAGTAAHFDGARWTRMRLADEALYDVHGSCATGVWLVGAGGAILRLRWN